MEARAVPVWLDQAIRAGELEGRFDLVVPVANERAARLVVQQQVPPLQVYGTTGRDWQAFLGRHVPLREDCLVCRFPEQYGGRAPRMACSTGPVTVAAERVATADAALPFLSVAAAALTVAETLKVGLPGFPVQPNFACLDFRGPLQDFLLEQREARPGCLCRAQAPIWRSLNASGRHASSS